MSRLIRLDRTGHTELASWTATDAASQREAIEAFRRELEEGMLASATLAVEDDDDNRRNDRDQPRGQATEPRSEANVDEAFHDDLTGQRPGQRRVLP